MLFLTLCVCLSHRYTVWGSSITFLSWLLFSQTCWGRFLWRQTQRRKVSHRCYSNYQQVCQPFYFYLNEQQQNYNSDLTADVTHIRTHTGTDWAFPLSSLGYQKKMLHERVERFMKVWNSLRAEVANNGKASPYKHLTLMCECKILVAPINRIEKRR